MSYVMVHSRWIKVAQRARVVVGYSRRTGGEPCGDTKMYSVCLVFLNGADLLCDCHRVMLCKSSGEYSETDITRLLMIG